MKQANKKLLNTKDAARITGYCEGHIRYLVHKGDLKVIRVRPGTQMRFLESDLMSLTQAIQSYPMAEDPKK